MNHQLEAFSRLLEIMNDLREKCPWDKKQTFETLRNLTIEETYELADAITEKDFKGIKEELGDLLLHIVFYAKIGSETGDFDIADVCHTVCDKLIARHPHIYGNVQVTGDEQVKQNWEKLKLAEGKESVLSGVPDSLPALIKSFRIQDKAGQVGFQWDKKEEVWQKVLEEAGELQEQVNQPNPDKNRLEDEFGDVLFALVNYARYLDIDPENALERTNKKFIRRFRFIEKSAKENGQKLPEMTLEEMDIFWNRAKENEQAG